ncbi:MAG: hypothetical protein K6B40_07480 [Firmicutes bacterium]|nr:hypothetical protein [Bacillota bacterium]
MNQKRLYWRSDISLLQKMFCGLSLVGCFLLIILAITGFEKYGKGIGYYLTIIMPFLSILAGMAAIVLKKYWWIVLAVIHIGSFIHMCLTSGTGIYGYIPWAIGYLIISGLVGYGFWGLTARG